MPLDLTARARRLAVAASVALLMALAGCEQQPIGDDPETARLVEQLHSGHPTWSKFAAFQLAERGEARAVPKLREILRTADEGDRWMAIRALPAIDDHRVPKLLIEAATRESGENLRISAVEGLARFARRPEVVGFLVERARKSDLLGAACIEALGAGRAPAGRRVAELYDAETTGEAGDERRRRIIEALGRIGDRGARAKLEEIVASSPPGLVDAARAARRAAQPPPTSARAIWLALALTLGACGIAVVVMLRVLGASRRRRAGATP